MTQRDLMRSLYKKHKKDPDKIRLEYAQAENNGEVTRSRNKLRMTSLEYAERLLYDGIMKGWISK
jgi:hypothetical protein